jgi:hypothetical protein
LFMEIEGTGLRLKIPSAPSVELDGIRGRLFSKMKRTGDIEEGTYQVDLGKSIGAGFKFIFQDCAKHGKVWGAGIGFEFELTKDLALSSIIGYGDISIQEGLVKAEGSISWESETDLLKAQLKGEVEDKKGRFCADGAIGFSIYLSNPLDSWDVYLGKEEEAERIKFKLLCSEQSKMSGFLNVNPNGIKVGIFVDENMEVESPTLDLGLIYGSVYASAQYNAGIIAGLQFDSFQFTGKSKVNFSAEAGAKYWGGRGNILTSHRWDDKGKITIASFAFRSEVVAQFPRPFCMAGKAGVSIDICGIITINEDVKIRYKNGAFSFDDTCD